jgi:anaerobic selenocysteine-containing dehydrogenase
LSTRSCAHCGSRCALTLVSNKTKPREGRGVSHSPGQCRPGLVLRDRYSRRLESRARLSRPAQAIPKPSPSTGQRPPCSR